MTNQETNVTNGFQTTLSSSLSSGATTINVDSTSGAPSVPFYVVIDPDVDAKREVVLVDSGKTATTLTLTAAGKRGQDGTSDVAHDSGAAVAVVPIAAHWTDINDRVEGHAHSGGTDGAAIATGDLTGHDKAAHDALNIDADTVDGSHASALLARANHTGTQAVSTLSDHDKANHDSLGLDATQLSSLGSLMAELEVDGSAEVASVAAGGASYGDLATVNLTIPADWSSWKCEAYGYFVSFNGGYTYDVRVEIDGTAQQAVEGVDFGSGNFDQLLASGRRTGMTTTGSRSIKLQARDNDSGAAVTDVYLYARAVRTS